MEKILSATFEDVQKLIEFGDVEELVSEYDLEIIKEKFLDHAAALNTAAFLQNNTFVVKDTNSEDGQKEYSLSQNKKELIEMTKELYEKYSEIHNENDYNVDPGDSIFTISDFMKSKSDILEEIDTLKCLKVEKENIDAKLKKTTQKSKELFGKLNPEEKIRIETDKLMKEQLEKQHKVAKLENLKIELARLKRSKLQKKENNLQNSEKLKIIKLLKSIQ